MGCLPLCGKLKSFVVAQIILELGATCLGNVVKTSFYSKFFPVCVVECNHLSNLVEGKSGGNLCEIIMNQS